MATKPLIVSVTSGKGGVGKTFISINLAATLAKLGKKILVVDCDLGLANIDIMLGINPQKTLQDVIFGNMELKDIIVRTEGGFDLIPSSSGVREMAQLLFEKIALIKSMISGWELASTAMFAPLRLPPCFTALVASSKTRMNESGPLAAPHVEDTGSPAGRIWLNENPVPPQLWWISAIVVSVEKIPRRESSTGKTKQAESWPIGVPAFIRVGEFGMNNNSFIT